MIARWLGASRAEVSCDGAVAHLGGEGEFNAMRMLLGTLAACDFDLIAMHAALIGLSIEELSVEVRGRFDVQRYLGLESPVAPGYQDISYLVRLRAPGATDEQIARLREYCERSSPVGETLSRAIPLSLRFEAT